MPILVMLLIFLVLMLLSMPVSLSMLISSLAYFLLSDLPLITVVQRMTGGINSFTLLAIPGFMLAGSIMNTGGITRRIFRAVQTPLRHINGGLGHANVAASVLFAGMTGSAIADTAGLGAIELEAMRDAGYDEDFSLAITGASSTIGPIIPPSIPMVLYAVAAGASIGRLFIGGILPGLLMAACLCIMVSLQCRKRNYKTEAKASFRETITALGKAFFPLMTPVILIGGMMSGVFTPTEAAIIAIVYAIVLCVLYKAIDWKQFYRAMRDTAAGTVPVLFVVAAANIFAWILSREQIPAKFMELLCRFIHTKTTALLFINLFLLVVGCFLDPPVAIPIVTPVLMPLVTAFGIDIVHFGVIMVLNLMIGLLTPPVGMILFVLSSVGKVPFEKVVKAVLPYLLALVVSLLIVTFWEDIVLILPKLIFD